MPPPWMFTGVSPPFGQNLLFLTTLLRRIWALPAPPGWPSSRTMMPWQFPLSRLLETRICRACLMKIPNRLP